MQCDSDGCEVVCSVILMITTGNDKYQDSSEKQIR